MPPKSVGVKVVADDFLNPLEIQARYLLSTRKLGLPFYGCQFDVSKQQYYLVHGILDYDLEHEGAFEYVRNLHPSIRWSLYQSWVIQIAEFAAMGFIHNDICRKNIVINFKASQTFIVGFSEVQKIGTLLVPKGQAFMWSPGKLQSGKQMARMADDLYSLVLVIASIEAKEPRYDLFAPQDSKEINMDCKWEKSEECVALVAKNVKRILQGPAIPLAQTGEKAHRLQTNLVGLLIQANEYFRFDFTPDEVISIAKQFVFEEKHVPVEIVTHLGLLLPRNTIYCGEPVDSLAYISEESPLLKHQEGNDFSEFNSPREAKEDPESLVHNPFTI
jgi:hypothetical protein